MATCTSCGCNVTGKKFCPQCGTPVQPAGSSANYVAATCPRCQGEVKAGAAFCMHCGGTLSAAPPAQPATRTCPACQAQVTASSAFCTSCGHDMHAPAAQPAPQAAGPFFCTTCGRQNSPDVRFCGGCGSAVGAAAHTGYGPTGQSVAGAGPYANPNPGYSGQGQGPYQQSAYPQTGYTPSQLDQSPYAQSPYPQTQYSQAQYGQNGYQPQPMLGQQPMVLRCPTCMAMSQLGTPACPSCRTSLAGIVPTPANGAPGQQQGGGFLQGNAGKYAMGALGGAAAVIGGEMLLNGIEDGLRPGHHHRRDDEGGGGLLDLANDIGLF